MQTNNNSGIQGDIYLPPVEEIAPAIDGQGGCHNYTFKVACSLARSCFGDFGAFVRRMQEWNQTCEPPWSKSELDHKIHNAWEETYGTDLEAPQREKVNKKKLSLQDVARIAKGSKGLFDQLVAKGRSLSIPPLEEIIDRIYPGNPLLCRAAIFQGWAGTGPREDIRNLEKEFEWLVPSPMSKVTGFAVTTGNPNSHRCIDNAGPMKYIVHDFDLDGRFDSLKPKWEAKSISIRDVQAALIHHLATTGKPRAWPFMIVDSGGKSLQSWFQINANFPKSAALALLARAVPLGADHRANEVERFFRFPGGTRKSEKGQPQPIILYDPSKLI